MPSSGNDVRRIRASDLGAFMRQGDRLAVLDVRRREAWTRDPEHIPGATWVPLEEVPQCARDLPPDTDIVLYCD